VRVTDRTCRSLRLAIPLMLGCFGAAEAAAQAPPNQAPDPNPSGRKYPARVYQTVRLDGAPPAIDGRLDDDAWRQGEWAGNYRQNLPTEGAPPSQPQNSVNALRRCGPTV